ncbi:MAG: tRNA (guanosine(37)-N1)-methyltransferase TrmD [Thermodesulfobacteriota bacterium]|nr:tRNA (guanosine(37)-N1)-methyltransferase TrmD [Thermodesulfobacteriota bacterium]
MKIHIITLFPGMFSGVFSESIIRSARDRSLVDVDMVDLREYGEGVHRVVDDAPYGGGGGMVMKPGPVADAIESIQNPGHVILTSPRGRPFVHEDAVRLSLMDEITIICGHYEGIDERVSDLFVDEEISTGDYVLTGGEIPAMAITDAVIRLLPGVLGRDTFETGDSHYNGLLEHPHYTRPRQFRGILVPEVLLGGDHENIRLWRKERSMEKTRQMRPDLLSGDKG